MTAEIYEAETKKEQNCYLLFHRPVFRSRVTLAKDFITPAITGYMQEDLHQQEAGDRVRATERAQAAHESAHLHLTFVKPNSREFSSSCSLSDLFIYNRLTLCVGGCWGKRTIKLSLSKHSKEINQ